MAREQDKPMAKGKWLSIFSSCFSSCLLPQSGHVTHDKGNIRMCEEIEAAPDLNSIDEPLQSLVALASTSAQCFQSTIVQSGWSQLPPELLQDIALFLSHISDQVRFRAVCAAWRAAVHVATTPKPSCIPCPTFVQAQFISDSAICTTSTLSFIPCALGDSYADLHQLGVVSGRICGSGHGWLVVFRDLDLTTLAFSVVLFNPLTRCLINLPSSESLTNCSFEDKCVAYEASKAAIALLDGSKSPATGCIVMITWYPHGFYFLRYTGENHVGTWTMVKLFSSNDGIVSFAYHKGTIFALYKKGRVFMVDTASLSRTLVDIPSGLKKVTLYIDVSTKIVELSGEVFLVVYMRYKVAAYVFRLDLTVLPPQWQQTKNIGSHVLFVGFNELQCLTMPDYVNSNLRKNCIYSIDPRGNNFLTYSICICQLDTRIVEVIPLHHHFKFLVREARWLLPSLI